MAELFLAQEPPRPDLFVIKRILPYLSEEPEFVQMFLDEARIAAQLHHPNIVQVFELGRIHESIFIAMEFVEGVDLRRILAEEAKFSSAVPYAVASRICAQVAAGLEHAHNSKGVDGRPLGLIHRDVSPQNVMVAYNGSVKLVDFGIAKAEALAERSKPGVIKGKFLYLSPEQVMQERLDHRSDIFALGVMLYEITTGRSPFARPTTEAILYAIRFENPSPPHLIRDDYPQELSRIVMKCLVKDRNQRYQRAAQVQADLEALLDSGVMRQSDDVQAYIARLLGEEEERTVLHVPIPNGRKESVSGSQPAGLAARPTRRSSGQNLPSAVDPDGEELATEMARPADMLAAAALGDEDDDEPTAIRTVPMGRAPEPPVASPRSSPRTVSAESTLQERPARGATAAARRSTPARKPATSGSVASLDRRRPPPVMDEDDDEVSQSGSRTGSTVNDRVPVRVASAFRDEDSVPDTRSGVSDEDDAEVSETLDLPRKGTTLAPRRDPDDDEPTRDDRLGRAPTSSGRSRGMRLLLVACVTLLLVVAGAAAWLFLLSPMSEDAPRKPAGATAATRSSEEGHPAEPPASTGTGTGSGTGSPSPESGTGSATAQPGGSGTDTSAGSALAGTGAPVVPTAGLAARLTEPPSASMAATGIRVQFQAPAVMSIKVGASKVKPNGFLPLKPGFFRVDVRCSNRGPWNTKDLTIPEDAQNPFVVKLTRADCPQKTRR
ncbi:serine/threonine-protein kinase [Archangium violaceum]|uniref:serine/threonine-protein kinase n=1 Tax=Archangium violaceum TaxID=83451 RepID=UPI001EF0129E|nr:serine/threonine-protein kinase [Archangium violaceum]